MLSAVPLPALTADEAAHAGRVAAHIRSEVAVAGGWIPFSRFMTLALYAPGLGYYSAGARKFGAGGDFITAPELTPVFARCVAAQVAEILTKTGGGTVLEAGAGSGALASALLPALESRGVLPARYQILEVSADLRQRQRDKLAREVPGLLERVEWLDAPPEAAWRGVVLANEVLDALPVERFRVTAQGVEVQGVIAEGEGFAFQWRPAGEALATVVRERVGEKAVGFQGEVCLMTKPWVTEMARSLTAGALLFVDYGLPRAQYYHPSRSGGSLCGFFRHRRVEDVLARPGLQDITAWVDFTAVAEAGVDAGFEVAGFATQAHFLLDTGLEGEIRAAGAELDTAGQAWLAQAAATLIMPGEMGERFKVLALTRGIGAKLKGFAFRDLARSL